MKGVVVERAGAGASEKSRVDAKTWAIEAVESETCQGRVDAKAFTGKGELGELRHQVDQLATIETQMVELSQRSKTRGLVEVYLMVHRRAETGYVFMRWREVGGSKRHLSWDALDARAATWGVDTKRWLKQMTARARELNDEHLRARKELERIRRRVMARAQPVYPRSIS